VIQKSEVFDLDAAVKWCEAETEVLSNATSRHVRGHGRLRQWRFVEGQLWLGRRMVFVENHAMTSLENNLPDLLATQFRPRPRDPGCAPAPAGVHFHLLLGPTVVNTPN
jgi:hypothetical protein